ncbi:MAG: hypothetical protein WCU80_09570, partial [Paludibacteraceae bacterium]
MMGLIGLIGLKSTTQDILNVTKRFFHNQQNAFFIFQPTMFPSGTKHPIIFQILLPLVIYIYKLIIFTTKRYTSFIHKKNLHMKIRRKALIITILALLL